MDAKMDEPFKPKKNKVSITLDSDTIEAIKTLADRDDRSFSQYINIVLKEHIKVRGLVQQG
ncbi:MAG: BrnA antitoxin family protein [Bacteroides sp.]|nr:BrnA antitoxin family protein [Bacteroides sp.]